MDVPAAATEAVLALPTIDFEWPILTEEGLRLFLHHAFGVSLPNVQVCPDHSTPWRALCEAYFAEKPASVWLGSRGVAGKTYTLGALALAEAIGLGADVKLLGGTGEQSKRVLETHHEMWQHANAPRHLLSTSPAVIRTRFKSGASIQALLASAAQVRGAHPQRLRLDEVDEMDMNILESALGQPQGKPGKPWIKAHVVFSSTRHHVDGPMTQILARAKERGWPVHAWCYKETAFPHGWLGDDDLERKRQQMSAEAWATEVELGEPLSEADYFSLLDLQACVDTGRMDLAPQPKVLYYAFVDPSGGKHDAFGLAIGHMVGEMVVVDQARGWQAPFNPSGAVAEVCDLLREYGIKGVMGDRYAGDWPSEAFRKHGVEYEPCEVDRSSLYQLLMPVVMTRALRMTDEPTLMHELRGLKRYRASSGKDRVDHRPGAHDDIANALAGLVHLARLPKVIRLRGGVLA